MTKSQETNWRHEIIAKHLTRIRVSLQQVDSKNHANSRRKILMLGFSFADKHYVEFKRGLGH